MKLYVGGRHTFFTFLTFFSDFKKRDFLRFFELSHTFSRTLPPPGALSSKPAGRCCCCRSMRQMDGLTSSRSSITQTLLRIQLPRVKGNGSPYSITERRVPQLIPVLGSQPAGDVSHKPGGRLPLLSARPAVTPATLKRAAANFAAW